MHIWGAKVLIGVIADSGASLSLTLLFEGNDELPGFHKMSQKQPLGELLYLRVNVHVFPLHVNAECVPEAERHKSLMIMF